MELNKWIKTGDRVSIAIDGKCYNTIIEGLGEEDQIYISLPQAQQKELVPEEEQILSLSSVNKRGIISLRVQVDGIDYNDNIPLIRATVLSEPKKIQRRRSYRTDVMLDVTVKKVPGEKTRAAFNMETINTKTLNISEDGMLFLSDGSFKVGDTLECDIYLDRFDINQNLEGLRGLVARCEDTGDGRHKTAVHFTDYSNKAKNLLIKFVVFSQRKKSNDG